MAEALDILKKYWGYDSFRPLQAEVIGSIAAGSDTLALMPTGGGKSLTFQVPALMREGICVVVTPLISLMKDQVDALRRRGIRALALHSGMSAREIDIALDNAVYGDYKFIYLSPERVITSLFLHRFGRMEVSLLVVDEAHCISQWGYDFRPAYLEIARLRQLKPDVPVLALTATATPTVAGDIMEKLLFREPHVLKMSFARPNLSYIVREVADKEEQLLRAVGAIKGSGIVYVRQRQESERIAKLLAQAGIAADFYHAGLSHPVRSVRQEAWMSGKIRVIVATNAFGMGIDKPDVRFVVHFDMPDHLEGYYQEAGRAGRDGKESFALLLYNSGERRASLQRMEMQFPSIPEIKAIYEHVFNYFQIAIGDGKESTREFDMVDFCKKFRLFGSKVVGALKILEYNGYLSLTKEYENPTRVMFTVGRDELYRVQLRRADLEHFIQALLRIYSGLFSDFVPVDEEHIARLSGYTPAFVTESFKQLRRLRVIDYIPKNSKPRISFLEERLPAGNLYISPESYARRRELAYGRLERMVAYAESVTECRSEIIRRYFGEEEPEPCGKCDICRSRRKK